MRQLSFILLQIGPQFIFKKTNFLHLLYTLKHALIKIINTPTCFGLIRPSSGSFRA